MMKGEDEMCGRKECDQDRLWYDSWFRYLTLLQRYPYRQRLRYSQPSIMSLWEYLDRRSYSAGQEMQKGKGI